MLFNSFVFAVFFPTVLILYWISPFRIQNYLLLVASYVFYGYWDWRFLSLIALSTIVDYISGIMIHRERTINKEGPRREKLWLILSICTNLGILGFFKYFNFFVDSFSDLVSVIGINPDVLHLNIILPVGISFYTFQTMSYTIDIYREKIEPTRKFLEFAVFVSFFPQLVAGPIERAKSLLPKILNPRKFNLSQFYEGLHLILLGLFKKVYVADNLAPIVDKIFSSGNISGLEVIVGAYTFAFQIYCDFSGYSDIARGCAKCMGIEIMINFRHPYVSINPSDFWTRWHISLSSWLRDYLYIPLGGNRKGTANTYRNLSLTMLLGGLWHGASWIFVLWGAYQGALLIGHRLLERVFGKFAGLTKGIPTTVKYLFKMLIMFQLVCVGWIIFRARSVSQVKDMMVALFSWQGTADWSLFLPLLQFAGPLVAYEAIQYAYSRDKWAIIQRVPGWVRAASYAVLFYLFAFYGASAENFIYFQF